MALVSAARYNELKAKIKAECQRRKYTSGGSSVETYGGTSYDYTTAPATGGKVLQEHKDKLITPMNAIKNENGTTGAGKILDSELI